MEKCSIKAEESSEILLSSSEIIDDSKTNKRIQAESGITDGGWGWIIVSSSFLINMVADGIPYSFGVLLVPLINEFKSSAVLLISFVGSINVGTMCLTAPFSSLMIQKCGPRSAES